MKTLKYLCLPILPLLLAVACSEPIEWEEHTLPEMLVVEGSFTNELKYHEIHLSLSAPYFSNEETPRVSNATVSLTDGTSVVDFVENPNSKGSYRTVVPVAGRTGLTYTLNIGLQEAVNGTNSYSATGELVLGTEIDSIDALIVENPFYIEEFDGDDSTVTLMIVYGQEPPETENYYQITLFDNYNPLNDTIDETSILYDQEGYDGVAVVTFFFTQQFQENDTVQLRLESVGPGFSEFVKGIQNVANQSFDPFSLSGPPANAFSNIMGANGLKAIGFYKFAFVSQASTLVRREDLPGSGL
jgi:hypothetical protein